MSYQKECAVCGRSFDARVEIQESCSPKCRKEFIRRYRVSHQKFSDAYKKYQDRYHKEHAEELNRKAVVRVRKWREKNKRKYLIQTNGKKCDGKWLEVMEYYEWTCAQCEKEAQLVHHIDEDTTNNSKKNLVALCRACHCREHKPWQIHTNN